MIKFNGVTLTANDLGELHEFARKIGLSRSWFGLEPISHYDVICPFKRKDILNYIKKRERYDQPNYARN